MRIAFLVPIFPAISQTFVLNQITWLLERGHHVDIFSKKCNPEAIVHEDLTKFKLMERTCFYFAVDEGKFARLCTALRFLFKYFSKNPLVMARSLNVFKYGREAISLRLWNRVAPFLNRYDILHCHFGMVGNWAIVLKDLGLPTKLVTTFHGCDIRAGLKDGGKMYQDLFEKGDCFISISKYNRQSLSLMGVDQKKMVDLPVGIEYSKFSGTRPLPMKKLCGPVKVITVARLVEEKGLHVGIKTLHKILKNRPQRKVTYSIIGEGPLRKELECLTQDLGLTDVVYFLGALPQQQIIHQLQHSHLFLLPSIAEALPVCLMEALAVGLPSVATKVGSIDQIIEEGKSGFLVEKGDVDLFAERLGDLIDHPEQWERMGTYGRNSVRERYDINVLNKRLVDLFQQLLDGENLQGFDGSHEISPLRMF